MMLLNYKRVLLLLGLLSFLPTISIAESDEYKYVLILQSAQKDFSLNDVNLPVVYRSTHYKLYLSKVTLKDTKIRYRLKLGFFKTRQKAKEAISRLRKKFTRVWMSNIDASDKQQLLIWQKTIALAPASINSDTASNVLSKASDAADHVSASISGLPAKGNLAKKTSKLSNAKLIMKRAKNAMTTKNYSLAIGLYSKIVNAGDSEYHKQALEFLGVAREKNEQLIHARAEYRQFLKKYPEGEDAVRVKQRLLALETVLLRPKNKLKKTVNKFSEWQNFGSFSQFYRNDSTTSTDAINSSETNSTTSTISSVFTYLARKRSDSVNIRSQLTASHLYYVDDPSRKERGRINIMFVDIADANNDKSMRIGRQSQNRAGAPGRMDGAWIDYRLTSLIKVNFVGGYPVNTTLSNSLQKNKPFYGISFDVSTSDKVFDYNLYTIEQKVDSIIDRNAVGTEIRYHKDKQNHFLSLDYDTYFNELNTLYFVGNWRFENETSLVASLNYRNSPILTTSNALQGQGTETIESLLKSLTEAQIKEIAQQRTIRYTSASLSSYFKLSTEWDFNADATVARLDSSPTTPANPPVVEILGQEGTGNEFYYNMQLISNNYFGFDEVNSFQISRIDTKTYKKVRYALSSSFKYKDTWRFRPKIIYEDRKTTAGNKVKKIVPAIRIDYKAKKNFKWEFDLSFGTSNETSTPLTPVDIQQNDVNLSAGFIWDF